MSKDTKLYTRIETLIKERLRNISDNLNTSMSHLTTELITELVNNEELLIDIYNKNVREQNVINEFVDTTFNGYLDRVSEAETTAEAIVYLRQSVANDNYALRYERMDKSLTQFAQNMGYSDIETAFYQDLSGFWSYEKVLGFLKAKTVKCIFISEITRLSRNIEAYLTIVNYAYKNHKKIYLNNTDITSGSGYLSGLIQAIFAEMELLSKQTSFSNYMLEVAQFLNETIRFEDMKDKKAQKLVTLAKYTDREQFIIKMIDKSIGVLEDSTKSDKLKSIAQSVLDEFKK